MNALETRSEYHMILDVLHESARQGDSKNTLLLGDLADTFLDSVPANDRIFATFSYREGIATLALKESIEAQTNQGELNG